MTAREERAWRQRLELCREGAAAAWVRADAAAATHGEGSAEALAAEADARAVQAVCDAAHNEYRALWTVLS